MIFISHAAADRALAEYLEATILHLDPKVEVFRTTRSGQIPAGRPWFDHIVGQLEASDRYAILLTPASQVRPWVNFETGVAFHTRRKLVPLLAAGLSYEDLVEPLRNLQAISLTSAEGAQLAFRELGLVLNDVAGFLTTIEKLGEQSRSAALDEQGWEQVVVDGARYAWDGPLDDLKESFGVHAPPEIDTALHAAGFKAQYGIAGDLWNEQSQGFRQVWKLDLNHRRRHPVVGPHAQVLLALQYSKVSG